MNIFDTKSSAHTSLPSIQASFNLKFLSSRHRRNDICFMSNLLNCLISCPKILQSLHFHASQYFSWNCPTFSILMHRTSYGYWLLKKTIYLLNFCKFSVYFFLIYFIITIEGLPDPKNSWNGPVYINNKSILFCRFDGVYLYFIVLDNNNVNINLTSFAVTNVQHRHYRRIHRTSQ